MSREHGYYAEFENLFVEWEFDVNDGIDVINVQMYDADDRDNTDKWADLTNLISANVRETLRGQIEEQLQQEHGQ